MFIVISSFFCSFDFSIFESLSHPFLIGTYHTAVTGWQYLQIQVVVLSPRLTCVKSDIKDCIDHIGCKQEAVSTAIPGARIATSVIGSRIIAQPYVRYSESPC